MKWTCDRCGEVHVSNPEECANCEHTVLTQTPDGGGGLLSSLTSSSETQPSGDGSWACSKCGHSHDREPFRCDECGGHAVRKTGDEPDPANLSWGGILVLVSALAFGALVAVGVVVAAFGLL